MRKLFYPAIILQLVLMNSCATKDQADLLVVNAKVYTLDSLFTAAEAFAVQQGKFIAIGSTKEILKKYISSNIIDASGMFVYPGFIDAHCHFFGYAEDLGKVNLTGTTSFDEVLERLKNAPGNNKNGWITGSGWDQNDWDIKVFPDRQKLDELFPDQPVIIIRIDGHAALANQKALEIAGITAFSKIPGGEILKKNGKVSGMLIDAAVGQVTSCIPKPGKDQVRESLLAAQDKCLAVGLTSVQDAGLGSSIIEIMDEMFKNGELKIRIYAMLSPTDENIKKYIRKGISRNENLHIRAVKLFADGALGSRGARLIEPYADDPGNSGLWITDLEFIRKICALADSCGYQVCTHCIGDAANHEILKIYSTILQDKNDKRWRIEHAQLISPGDFELFGRFGIIPSVQTTHATSDMYWATDRLGSERVKNAYAYKKLLSQNGWIPNGSDFPVEDINPLYGFYAAVARKDKQGNPSEGFQPENALNREEALKAMTIWAARSAFEEDVKGSIEPGKFADFVICSGDIMEIKEDQVFSVKVKQTYISGNKVFGD